MTKAEFVQKAYAAAAESSRTSGMPPMVAVAQAALESSWGQSRLSRQANNYFGIKAFGAHNCIEMTTEECKDGRRVAVKAAFATYHSMIDCFRCHDSILASSAIYASAREVREDEQAFIREIARHWATDPKYGEKLSEMVVEVRELLKGQVKRSEG